MQKSALLLLFWLLPAFVSGQKVQEAGAVSNLQFLNRMLDSTLAGLVSGGVLSPPETVKVVVKAGDSLFASYVQDFLANGLFERGMQVASGPGGTPSAKAGKTLVLRWIEWSVSYIPVHRWFGLRKSGYQRNISAEYIVQLLKPPDGRVIYSSKVRRTLHSPVADISAAEKGRYPFLHGQMLQKRRRFLSLLEPVFLFAISGTVVYLFYAVRSK